jgi:4a-hydroxytetrahydrobiopterin dehydratase
LPESQETAELTTACSLTDKHCVPCEGGVPTLTRQEAEQLLLDLPGWTLSEDDKMISRRFEFRGFFRTM